MHKRKGIFVILLTGLLLAGCANSEKTVRGTDAKEVETGTNSDFSEAETTEQMIKETSEMKALNSVKNPMEHNPLITHKYSADPYAMVYDGRVYLYMTGDETMYEADGTIKKNNYSNIDTIRVISSEDLVNWTDHGDIFAAGKNGQATWGNNSWAPAACWKMIDGKPKFFLYFANSGNGIAVLTSDSPTGPFVDPLGEAIVSRKTPTCAEVTWLFDPAVLVDEDGTGYLYFGGGIPSDDKISNPGTARVAKLTDDMIHLDGDPKPIENVLYLFEDSGINKVGDKYIYSYCSNFNVPPSGCEGYGFGSGEIIQMAGDSPMGPFKTVGSILKNPEFFFKNGGNNHHCMFEFKDKWYVTYHASLIEEKAGVNDGYRSVNIDSIDINEDGVFAVARGTKEGVEQLQNLDPFKTVSFSTMSNEAGIKTVPADDITAQNGVGNTNLLVEEDGAFIQLTNVEFGDGATSIDITLKAKTDGAVSVRIKYPNGEETASLVFKASEDFVTYEVEFSAPVKGVENLFFVFEGVGTELKEWKCK